MKRADKSIISVYSARWRCIKYKQVIGLLHNARNGATHSSSCRSAASSLMNNFAREGIKYVTNAIGCQLVCIESHPRRIGKTHVGLQGSPSCSGHWSDFHKTGFMRVSSCDDISAFFSDWLNIRWFNLCLGPWSVRGGNNNKIYRL
jgi:hypothetical protein